MRGKRDGILCNFYVYYDFDGDECKTVLRLDEYNGVQQFAWVLLEPIEKEAEPTEVAATPA